MTFITLFLTFKDPILCSCRFHPMYKTLYTLVFDVDAADDGGDDNSRDSL